MLADGRFVTASETRHPDLFWALRGGGGNFGVVTSFLFRPHPVKMVFAGPIFWDVEHASEIMRAYRDFLPKAPEELGPFLGPQDRAIRPIRSREEHLGQARLRADLCFNGSQADGRGGNDAAARQAARPAVQLDGRDAVAGDAGMFDPFFPKGLQWYWKGDFVKALPDEAIDAHIADARKRRPTFADASLSDRRRRSAGR